MKRRYWLGALVILLLCAAHPALGQGPRGGRDTHTAVLPGKIVTIDAKKKQATLALYTRADSPDAPGKVPDDMAQQAATLAAQADQLEKQGKVVRAEEVRRLVDELLRWRQSEVVVTANDEIELTGICRNPLSKISKGDRVRVEVSVPGVITAAQMPGQVTLIKHIIQVDNTAEPKIQRIVGGARVRTTFFILTGEITDTDPLTLTVGGKSVHLTDAEPFGYYQRVPLAVRELTPGQRLFAGVKLTGGKSIESVTHLTVLIGGNELFDTLESAETHE